jgi:drug/metabolite transporter (DMT)-like permease
VFLGERFRRGSALGMLIAGLGLALIGWQASRPGAWGGHFGLSLAFLILATAPGTS